MNTPESKLRVAPTSALVLSYVRDLYREGLSGRYMQHIDLSAVKELVAAVDHISTHFGPIIQLRKKMVRYLIKQFINRYPRQQVCIIAAGLDPLGLTLAEDYPMLVTGIYEVDQAWMQEKKAIYRKIASHLPLPVTIQTDVTNTIQLIRQLRDAGYDASQPTIIIFEGIIHYISEEQFRDIMQCFTTRNGRNTVIMDYLLVGEEITTPRFRKMGTELVALAEKALGVDFHRYSRKKVLNILELLNAEVYNIYDMQAAEYIMQGQNQLYNKPGDGVLEMAAFHL
ncbi:class I SAM-dependent methyltransferase [Chitinophaga japonensis]|uniref:Leucine carboxyl methyltransferase n=1 Tax=Chitinophaga japonensis TaxID=104662 RepID=A0A562TGB9_CHIJA|nr:class I SAM-dependent methyltransferase [Chitinophaga japonensis]TWI92268.1 leucine carboxyl methyltransferase [Chitinophaga japonensis]